MKVLNERIEKQIQSLYSCIDPTVNKYYNSLTIYFVYPINITIAFILSFVMFLDWFIQFIKIKNSTNARRLITGIIGGYGVATIQMYIYTYLFKAIYNIFL